MFCAVIIDNLGVVLLISHIMKFLSCGVEEAEAALMLSPYQDTGRRDDLVRKA